MSERDPRVPGPQSVGSVSTSVRPRYGVISSWILVAAVGVSLGVLIDGTEFVRKILLALVAIVLVALIWAVCKDDSHT